ncbi:ATP-binding protein [Kitasatospora sp. NPDC001574]
MLRCELGQSPGVPGTRRAEADDEDGRGLLIADALTESWGWRSHPVGKVVWDVLPLTSPGAPEPN